MSKIDLDKVRDYCEDLLREDQTDNLYFGQDKGSIYWVEGAECWCYQCGNKTEWGQADDLLSDIDDKILFSYYEENREEIDYYLE
tara:strand:- start:3 stop:257 length:255 start_codon:yes stop_codon:yes gene_type:complete